MEGIEAGLSAGRANAQAAVAAGNCNLQARAMAAAAAPPGAAAGVTTPIRAAITRPRGSSRTAA